MKKMRLYYFSGTGMTKYIVDRLAGEFENRLLSVDCFRIECADIQDADLSECDILGIAYPVHSFNAPRIVVDFIKQLPASGGLDTFIVGTVGEENKLNHSASDLIIKKLKNKGYKVFYNRFIEMPSNFITKYEDDKVRRILNKARQDIPQIAQEIAGLSPYFTKQNLVSKIVSVLGRVEWTGARMMGKSFCVSADCTCCGKCADDCPSRNIEMSDSKISFKRRCGLCMRCVYGCPKNAISVRRPYKFILFDKWYDPELFTSED